MPKQDNVPDRIVQAADKLFFTYGYSRVTVDEIAASLGMSKKTIYKHFASKEALLQAVVTAFAQEIAAGNAAILQTPNTDFITKLEQFISFMGSKMDKIQSPQMGALQKEAPQVWSYIETLRQQHIHSQFSTLLQEGVDQGIIRADIDLRLAQLVILAALETVAIPGQATQLPLTGNDILRMTFTIIFQGLLVR